MTRDAARSSVFLAAWLALIAWATLGAPARPRPGRLQAAVTGRAFAALLAVAATGLVAWGVTAGEPAALADLATR